MFSNHLTVCWTYPSLGAGIFFELSFAGFSFGAGFSLAGFSFTAGFSFSLGAGFSFTSLAWAEECSFTVAVLSLCSPETTGM